MPWVRVLALCVWGSGSTCHILALYILLLFLACQSQYVGMCVCTCMSVPGSWQSNSIYIYKIVNEVATVNYEFILAKWLTQKDKAWNIRKTFQKKAKWKSELLQKTTVCTKYNYLKFDIRIFIHKFCCCIKCWKFKSIKSIKYAP